MKVLKLSVLAVMLLAAPEALAQSTGDTLKTMVFNEVEKRIVRDYFGVTANQQTQDPSAPEWAVKDQRNADNVENNDDNEDEDGDKRGKKEKGKKGKKDGKDKGKSKGLPPGLAKRDQLPPGLQRQLERNGRLPSGLAKRDLPADLMSRLPKRANNQDVTLVEGDVVLLDKATGIILDVIKDVVTNGAGGGAALPNPDGTLAAPSPQNQSNEPTVLDSILKSIFGN